MEPLPLFEDGFWARGDQDNGHSRHCCSALHPQLNGRGAAFLTDETDDLAEDAAGAPRHVPSF